MSRPTIDQHLVNLEIAMAQADYHDASGLVVRTYDQATGYTQVIGPFKKDTAEAFEMAEQLENESCVGGDLFVDVTVEFLFPALMGEKQ